MADHVRSQIRAALVAALGGLATTGTRVFDSPVDPLGDAQLPGLAVYALAEEIPQVAISQARAMERALELVVEAHVKHATGYAATLDGIIKEVEIRVAANQGAGGAKYVQLRSIAIEATGEADKQVAVARLAFEALYYTALGSPEVIL